MSSILTNNGAMVALQTLKSVNDELEMTTNAISTGKSVGTAADNAAVWSIATTMETDVSAFEKIEEGLSVAEATVSVASAGAEQIVDTLSEIQDLLVDADKDGWDYDTVQESIDKLTAQITSIIDSAQFNGTNLLATDVDGNSGTNISVISSPIISSNASQST